MIGAPIRPACSWPSQFAIRSAEPGSGRQTPHVDLPDVRRLWNTGAVTRFVGFPNGIGVSDGEMRAWWQRLMATPGERHFTIETDDLGYCGETFYRYRGAEPADLDIKLLPTARGLGLGAQGLSHALDRLFCETDAHAAYVSPRRDNQAARELYRRLGFRDAAVPEPRPEFVGEIENEYLEMTRDRWLGTGQDSRILILVQSGEQASLNREELLDLYNSARWTAYTDQPETLIAGIAASDRVTVARHGQKLVGLARTVSDGETIAYLQDILVRPEYQRRGIGGRLVTALLNEYPHVRQRVLITDAEPGQRAFYESLGFTEVHDQQPAGRAFVSRGSASGRERNATTR